MKVVYVRGGDKLAPKIAELSGMEYGTRHDYKAYAPVYMLDIHWRDYDWVDYLAILTAHMPTLAMVADYEHPSQREMMHQQIADLRAIGIERVMCCPKFVGACADIPNDVILAISVPTGYAGFMPPPDEVGNRDVHLLGGHPDQQAYCIYHKYAAANVVSVDGNILALKAGYGQYWRETGGWQKAKHKEFTSEELALKSAVNIVTYLHEYQAIFDGYVTARVKRCMYTHPLL